MAEKLKPRIMRTGDKIMRITIPVAQAEKAIKLAFEYGILVGVAGENGSKFLPNLEVVFKNKPGAEDGLDFDGFDGIAVFLNQVFGVKDIV